MELQFNFKLMVIREAEKTNNCAAARKFSSTENNVKRWWQQKDELSNTHSTRMAFRGPKKKGRFNEIDVSVVKFITEISLQGFPVTTEAIQIKGQEIAHSLNISEDQFTGSMGWCKRMMCQNGLALR
jgi:hypothetical protein